jgi:phosphatidylserine/phosphatidylglycerophosphate/cardiolipin synthase-like enzyme
VLVDGADALPAIADAIESAESHVWLAGWHFSPEFRLPSGQSLRELLAEAAGRVHAKIRIVADRWLTIGSANVNEHSLFNDTERNVVTRDPELARETRLRLWAEHLECEPGDLAGDPTGIVDERWRAGRGAARAGPPRRPRDTEAPSAAACLAALHGDARAADRPARRRLASALLPVARSSPRVTCTKARSILDRPPCSM